MASEPNTFGDRVKSKGHAYTDSHEYFEAYQRPLLRSRSAFVLHRAHAYCFCDPRRFTELELAFQLARLGKFGQFQSSGSKNQGMLPRPEHGPRRCYGPSFLPRKVTRKTRVLAPDTIIGPECPWASPRSAKPSICLSRFSIHIVVIRGTRVIDPFCGSGTIFAAANTLKLKT